MNLIFTTWFFKNQIQISRGYKSLAATNIKKHSHSRLRYLCTLGFPLMAAILTGLQPGLIISCLAELRPVWRFEAETVLDCWPRWPWCPLNNENETSESVPVFVKKRKKKMQNKIHMGKKSSICIANQNQIKKKLWSDSQKI